MDTSAYINNERFNELFPFYFVLDKSLSIIEAGRGLLKLHPEILNQPFQHSFKFKRPFSIKYEFSSVIEYSKQVFILETVKSILFRGQMLVLEQEEKLIFVGSPWMTNIEDLKKHNLLLTDFALHDAITDMLQLLKSNEIVMTDLKKVGDDLSKQKQELEHSERKLKESDARLNIQYAISQHLSTSGSLNETISHIIETVCNSTGWECGSLFTIEKNNKDMDVMRCIAYWQADTIKDNRLGEITQDISFAKGVGLPGRIWENHKPEWISDLMLVDNFLRASMALKAGLRGVYGFPVLFDNKIVGIIEFFSNNVQEPDADLIDMFEASCQQIGQFIIRKNTEEDIKESEQRYKQLVEGASDIIFKTDYKGFFKYINPLGATLLGLSEEEITGMHFTELVRPDYLESTRKFYESQFRNKTSKTYFEFPIVNTKNREIWIGQNVNIIYEGNRISEFQVIARDITERKRNEEQLKALNEELKYFKFALDQSSIVAITDHEGTITYANDNFCKISQYSREELIGKTHNIINSGYHSKGFFSDLWKSISGGKVWKGEIKNRAKDGSFYWVNSTIVPFIDENGKPYQYIAIRQDISEQKFNEENLKLALKENSAIKFALDKSTIVVITNPDGVITYVNDRFCEITKYSPQELLGRDHRIINSGYHSKEFFSDLWNTLENGKIWKGEIKNRAKDGSCFWLETTIVPLIGNTGKPYQYIAIRQDITEKKEGEEKIKLSERKFRSIIENMHLGLLEVSASDTIIEPNDRFCKMTGYSREELIGENILDILFTGKKFRSILSLQNVKKMAEGKSVFEIQMKTKDGGEIWVMVSEAPLHDLNNNIIGVIGIYLDITERKNVEQEILKAKKLAEQSKKTKEQFLANMSHEIRTPMNAIVGMTDILIENNQLSFEEKEYVDAIKLSADNLLSIINDILDFSKIESGKIIFENSPFELQRFFDGIIQTLNYTATQKGLSLNYCISNEIPDCIIGDQLRLRQILLNLVGNAIKFTEKGGIRINIQLKELNGDDYTILFNVSDTGIGIPEDKLSSIFQSFTQASNDTTRKYGGTGLGLTICKELVELQGGAISVTSKINEGSIFSFSLTFKKDHNKRANKECNLSNQEFNELCGVKVLLVEDNIMNQMLAKKVLNKWNCEFDVADNGKIAIEKLEENNYDIILMDMQMPVMDGYEATKHIRGNMVSSKSRVPIIALTAHAIIGEAEKCINAGMNDYISKPFNQGALYEKIIRLIKNNGSERSTTIEDAPKTLIEEEKNVNTENIKYTDLTYLKEIADGSNEFIIDMINTFMIQTPQMLHDMKVFLNEKRWPELRGIAHKMKPTIDFMGLRSIKDVVRNIEKYAAAQTNLEELPDLIFQMNNVCVKAMEELKIELKEIS